MAIEFECKACLSTLRVPDENAGKKARCPSCQTIVMIPGVAPLRPLDDPYGSAPSPASTPPVKPFSNAAGGTEASGSEFSRPEQTNYPDATNKPYSNAAGQSSYSPYGPGGTNNPYGNPTAAAPGNRDNDLRGRILSAGITMMVFNILGLILAAFLCLGVMINFFDNGFRDDDIIGSFVMAFGLLVGNGFGVYGSFCMTKHRNYTMSMVGAIGTILAGMICCCVPSIAGVFSLVVLLDGRAKHVMHG